MVKFTPSTLYFREKSPGTRRWPGGAVWTFRRINFSVLKKSIDRLWGPYRRLSDGNKVAIPQWIWRTGREADPSPVSSAKVRNEWSHTYIHSDAFMSCAG